MESHAGAEMWEVLTSFLICFLVLQDVLNIILTLSSLKNKNNLFYYFLTFFMQVKMKLTETGKAEVRKAEFLAAGLACEALFWPTPGLKRGEL